MIKLALGSTKIGLRTNTVLRYRTIIDFFSALLEAVIILVAWYFFFHYLGVKEFNGYSFKDLVVYYIIVSMLSNLIYSWLSIHFDLQGLIISGKISNFLTKPWNIVIVLLFKRLGNRIPFLLTSLLIFIVVLLLSGFNLSLLKIIEFITITSLSLIFYFSLLTLIGLLAFWFEDIWSISWMFFTLVHILSGRLFPLEFYPKFVLKFLDYLPFKYLYSTPTKTLMEGISFSLFLKSVFILAIYTLIFSLVAKKLWDKGIKKINVYGG